MSGSKYTPWGLGSLLKGGKKEAQAPAITSPPDETDAEVQEAARGEAAALRKRRGWRASLVTGPMGLTSTATTEKSRLGQ